MIKFMPTTMLQLILGISIFLVTFANAMGSSSETEDKTIEVEGGSQEEKKDQQPLYKDPPTVPLSKEQKTVLCRKYSNQLVGFAGEFYLTSKVCTIRKISSREATKLMSKNIEVKEVTSEVLQAFVKKQKKLTLSKNQKKKLLAQVEGKCINSAHNIYLVEKGHKRIFPDWATFESYKRKHKKTSDNIIYLTKEEVNEIPIGEPLPSIIDESFKNFAITPGSAPEVLPLPVACDQLQSNQVYSYYSKLYIKKSAKKLCHLEEIDHTEYADALEKKGTKELSRDSYFSIPKKKPLKKKTPRNSAEIKQL